MAALWLRVFFVGFLLTVCSCRQSAPPDISQLHRDLLAAQLALARVDDLRAGFYQSKTVIAAADQLAITYRVEREKLSPDQAKSIGDAIDELQMFFRMAMTYTKKGTPALYQTATNYQQVAAAALTSAIRSIEHPLP